MVNTNTTKVTYQGDGQTTVFPFTFPFNDTDYIHIAIYDTETKEISYPTKDYVVDEVAHTVTYPGYAKGQEIKESERPAVLDSKKRITIFRLTDIDQLVDLGEKYPLPAIEGMSDKITEILQELKEQLSRAILVKLGSGEDPQKVYDNIWDYAKRKAEMAFNEPNVTKRIQRAIDEAVAAAQKELAVLDANDILGKVDTLFNETAGLKETTDSITATVKENKTTQDGENEKLASQIKQNADSITATVAKNKADTDKAISEVKQTADGISTTVAQNKKDADTAISKVDQKADSISATVQANKTSTDTAISNVNQRADSITTTVQEQKEQFDGKIGGLSSQITQNADSITSVITNLKDTDKAKAAGYSAITQLQDEINLRVKTADYNGKNIVNQINLNSGGVLIDGTRLHITGDTKIDKDLIVGGNIKAGSLTIDNLSQGAIEAIAQSNYVEGEDRQYCRFTKEHSVVPRILMLKHDMEDTKERSNWHAIASKTEDEKKIVDNAKIQLSLVDGDGPSGYTPPTDGTVTQIGAQDITTQGFRIMDSMYFPAKTKLRCMPAPVYTTMDDTYTKEQDSSPLAHNASGTNTFLGYIEFTAPSDCTGCTVEVESSAGKDEPNNEEGGKKEAAGASIKTEILVNGAVKYEKFDTAAGQKNTKTWQMDFKKGDKIRVNFERYEGWTMSSDGYAYDAQAGCFCTLSIYPFISTEDIILAKGTALFLTFDIQNKQYTLED